MNNLKKFFLYSIRREVKVLVWAASLSLSVGLVGVSLNLLVVKLNNGLMPVAVGDLFHGIPQLEEGKHTLATKQTRLDFLTDYIPIDNRWLDDADIPGGVRFFADTVGYGPGGLYYASVGDVVIWSSLTGTLLFYSLLLACMGYYMVRSGLVLLWT